VPASQEDNAGTGPYAAARPGPSLALDLDASGIPSSGIDAP
jgi:hypothetical protein